MVSIFDLCFSYTEEPPYLLNHLSLDIPAGAYWSVVGPNGAGKSTFIKLVLGLLKPTSGRIEISAQGVGYVPQMSAPAAASFPITAEEVLDSWRRMRGIRSKDSIDHALSSVGMSAARHTLFGDLSGGQRQRIGIVRALAVNPKLIFCDESVSALDVSVQAQILNLFQSLKEQFHLTYVFIGHDLAVVRYISDRVMVMYLGKVMEIAPYSELTGDNIHPYTRALLSAVPEPSIALHKERILLEGDIPSAVDPPAGCRFCQRCFMAKPICFEQEPDMKTVGPDHCVRCHFAKEG